jgi:hypothetical protein
MKVTIKKNLIIFHKLHEFETLHDRLMADHGRSTMLISWKMKRELGFTIRNHKGLVEHDKDTWEVMKSEGWNHRYHYESQVHVDFYSEAQQSWFVLKYLNN